MFTSGQSETFLNDLCSCLLLTRHDIVAPTFRAHYGNAPTKDEYEIMPWQHGVAYRCLLCLRDRKQAPWDFDKLNVHFSAA